jgi:hypothetical protein
MLLQISTLAVTSGHQQIACHYLDLLPGHYISEDGQLESAMLALIEIEGEHSGENLARYLQGVVEDWGISSKLGYIQMDNASNNDKMMQHFEDRK